MLFKHVLITFPLQSSFLSTLSRNQFLIEGSPESLNEAEIKLRSSWLQVNSANQETTSLALCVIISLIEETKSRYSLLQ